MTMSANDAAGMAIGISELVLSLVKRSKGAAVSKDRRSLRLLWIVILASVTLAVGASHALPQADSAFLRSIGFLGFGLIGAGTLLRWWSILHLGRFFTVDVAVAPGQRVVDTGPYLLIRHPSYTGALMAFLGLGIGYHNWAALVILVLPVALAFLGRIAIEEKALGEGLGASYAAYCARTRRLIPWVY